MYFTVTPQEFGSDHAALNISTAEDYNKEQVISASRIIKPLTHYSCRLLTLRSPGGAEGLTWKGLQSE